MSTRRSGRAAVPSAVSCTQEPRTVHTLAYVSFHGTNRRGGGGGSGVLLACLKQVASFGSVEKSVENKAQKVVAQLHLQRIARHEAFGSTILRDTPHAEPTACANV
jgi:hypothetical protein